MTDENLSSAHQPSGSAARPSDTLDRGQRAPKSGSGEVVGSGAGTGGGNPGEDYDDDSVNASGTPPTGKGEPR